MESFLDFEKAQKWEVGRVQTWEFSKDCQLDEGYGSETNSVHYLESLRITKNDEKDKETKKRDLTRRRERRRRGRMGRGIGGRMGWRIGRGMGRRIGGGIRRRKGGRMKRGDGWRRRRGTSGHVQGRRSRKVGRRGSGK